VLSLDSKSGALSVRPSSPICSGPLKRAFLFSLIFHLGFFSLFRISEKKLPRGPEKTPQKWVVAEFSPSHPSPLQTINQWSSFSAPLPSSAQPIVVELCPDDEMISLEKWRHTPYEPELENDLR
jgi:hypothetical protein